MSPYKNGGERPGQLSLRKTSQGGLNKLEVTSVQVVGREGKKPNKGVNNLAFMAQDKNVKCILLVGDPTHPLSTLTFSYCNWIVGRPGNKAGLNTQLLSNHPIRYYLATPHHGCLLHTHLHGVRVECVLYITLPDNAKMADSFDSH